MINIEEPGSVSRFALFHLGFRPFFLGAALFSVAATAGWMAIYLFGLASQPFALPAIYWHAHEMIFGYAMAVIAGFLLTAVKNWTGLQTPRGLVLASLFLLWIGGRILPFFAASIDIIFIGIIDCLFIVFLLVAITFPIVRKQQWKNIGIVALLLLILAANATFYLGAAGKLGGFIYWGLYSGLYLELALIFVMGRRVIPFFIERGIEQPVQLANYKWLDNSSLVLFALFSIVDVFIVNQNLAAILALGLFILHSIRLVGWHTPGLWRKPLLWILMLAYGWLAIGFLLKAAAPVLGLSPFLAIHAFAYGGIGLMTVGMMARVALGHTGRNIQQPPALLGWIFIVLFAGAVVRVVLPIFSPAHYAAWIGLSQTLWIIAFAGFLYIYFPILVGPRIDGKYG